jgi:hypothetical protein
MQCHCMLGKERQQRASRARVSGWYSLAIRSSFLLVRRLQVAAEALSCALARPNVVSNQN